MTVLVYRAGLVAADSQVCRADMVAPELVAKVWRVQHGGLGGIVGNMAILQDAKQWLDGGSKSWERTKIPGDTYIVEWLTDGTIFEHTTEGTSETRPSLGYYAWGSGRDFAYGALFHGATAFGAVEAACRFDLGSGGEILQLRVVNEDTDDGA